MCPRIIAFAAILAFSAFPQRPSPSRALTPNDRPDIQTLSRTVRGLRTAATIEGEAAGKADQLLQDAASLLSLGQTGLARQRLAKAQALISSKPWVPKDDFAWSLHLRLRKIVMEPGVPQIVDLAQVYPAPYKPGGALRVRLSLTTIGAQPKLLRDFGAIDVPSRDLIAEPLAIPLALQGTPDGSYHLLAEVSDDGGSIVILQQTIALADGIESRTADVERRLGRIQGHDSAKQTVRWPYDMARVVNLGLRKLETGDFGLPETGGQVFDFSKELSDSASLLKSLEAGKDPLFRARGDHERHYWFEAAGEIMPYRVYAPTTWDGKKQLPMIFVLHGNTRDHNFYFDRDGGLLAKLAEKHGYLVATTMGYRPSAGYNASAIASLLPTPAVRSDRSAAFARTPEMQRETELSEKDAMNAFELIVKEFTPNPRQIYIFGHSAGGTGGWYIGSKYAEKFAGVALSAFTTQPANVPFDRLKGKPILVIVGSKDTPRTVATARTMAKAVADNAFDTRFLEIPEATHDTIVGLALPSVFEFFEQRAQTSKTATTIK